MTKSECLQYQLSCYPRSRTYRIAIAMFHVRHMKKAEGLTFMIDKYIDTYIPLQHQKDLLKHYEKMTALEKKYPGRINDKL